MATYNGHKNWNHWNVSLWINNDEGLYRLARQYARQYKRQDAARAMLSALSESSITETPDGAPYTVSAILGAMRGI